MSFSPNSTFYDSLNFDNHLENKPLSPDYSNHHLSFPVYDVPSALSNGHSQGIEYRQSDCAVRKEITFSPTYPVKAEQYHDYSIDNSHFNFGSMNNNNSGLVYNFFTENYNIFQQLSPQLSYTDHSPLDVTYEDKNHTPFDYFMSSSPTASYSLSPPPILSPEAQTIGLNYGDTTENNKYNYRHAALGYPSVEAEVSACCNLSDDFISFSSATHEFPQEDNVSDKSGINISYVNQEQDDGLLKSTACSVVTTSSSSGEEMMGPKKIYPCNYCKRSFARKYDVARHKRIHTGSKPYVCPHCLKGFSRSDARVRHFRTEIACRDGADKLGRPKTQKLNPTITSKH